MSQTPGGVFVRRAEFDDSASIQALVGDDAAVMAKRFGAFDVTTMIETATLGITAVDEKGAVVGYAAFFDYPALTPGVDAAAWPSWLHANFGHPEYTPATASWLAFFVADALCQNEVAESILRTAFTTLSEADAILFALPQDVRAFAPVRDTFEPLQCLKPDAVDVKVHACHRGLYLPDLLIREARVEDHDDLVPVFNAQSEVLTERYGEFFIAELIERQDPSNVALVAEVDGHAIGLLALSSEIDVQLLKATFDLDPYAGLEREDEAALAAATDDALAAAAAKKSQLLAKAEAASASAAAAVEAAAQAAEEAANSTDDKDEDDDFGAGAAKAMQKKAEALMAEAAAFDETKVDMSSFVAPPKLPNAFCISVFCMDESFESRSTDFLHAAFAAFPDREYAVLTLPHTTSEFSLVNAFTQAEPLPSSSFGHILYLFHRDALGGPRALTIRPANVIDGKAVGQLLANLKEKDDLKGFFDAATGPPAEGEARTKTAYVAECVGVPVGLVLLDDACDVSALSSQYALEDFILFSEHQPDAHALLHALVLNPIFTTCSRFFLREVFRQHKKSCVYLQLKPGQPVPTVLPEFVQAKPRRQPTTSLALQAEQAKQREQLGLAPKDFSATPAGSLYFLTRKLLSEPKIINNSRIVVVGSSDAAIALLEALISVPYLFFSYLYLVAPQAHDRLRWPRGEPGTVQIGEEDYEKSRPYHRREESRGMSPFFARTSGYTKEELATLGIGARVRVVDSAMADIDRAAKAIVLPDGSILPYDYLVLAPEFGDQSLTPLGADALAVRGAFSLFDDQSTSAALQYVKTTYDVPSGRTFIYGGSLDAYTTIEALASLKIPFKSMVLVTPPGQPDEEVFADPRVRQKVDAKLEKLGVQLVSGMRLVGLSAEEDGTLANVMLEADGGGATVSQPCTMLVCAGLQEVERKTFEAINGNSLVYDGRLVVDTHFCTNDTSVYASGVIAKFSRRYRSKLNLGTVAARECGAKLAQALLPVLDPLSATSLGAETPVPTFEKPIVTSAILPGGLQYVAVSHPTPGCETYIKARAHPSFGRELITSDTVDTFCSVRLDSKGVVRAITYLGREPVEVSNWTSLIGLPEAALNNLAPRFDEGIVTDLPAFLRQNWAVALYHDRFGEFNTALRAELATDETFIKAMETLRERPEFDSGKLSPVDFMNLLPEEKRNLVRTRLLDYVAGNQNQLDMYLVPGSAIMRPMEEAKLR